MSKGDEREYFRSELNPLKGLEYKDYETKINLLKSNLGNIKHLLVKGSYLKKRGFKEVMELRYNNKGVADDFGIGKEEFFAILDKMVREYPLEQPIYVCFTTIDKDISYIGFYV